MNQDGDRGPVAEDRPIMSAGRGSRRGSKEAPRRALRHRTYLTPRPAVGAVEGPSIGCSQWEIRS